MFTSKHFCVWTIYFQGGCEGTIDDQGSILFTVTPEREHICFIFYYF